MTFFETIDAETRRRNLQFLVIGGLAVNLYGYSRDTADLDLLICADQREQWLDLFSRLGYVIYKDGGNFIQLSSQEHAAWPVDLMLVQGKTFSPMFTASREAGSLWNAFAHSLAGTSDRLETARAQTRPV